MTTELRTERLFLRCYRPGDGAEYFRALQENRDHLLEFMPRDLAALGSAEDAEVVIAERMAAWRSGELFVFGAWEAETGACVGKAYLATDWGVPCIELGYFCVKSRTGRGIATEAARAAIRFAFERLHVERVELQCASDNAASIRVAARCGFRSEARLRIGPIRFGGAPSPSCRGADARGRGLD